MTTTYFSPANNSPETALQMASVLALRDAIIASKIHPDTLDLVHQFSKALIAKLASSEKKYGYTNNWKSPCWMDSCRAELIDHIYKGDPLDVAAYCAFLWYHGESTKPDKT